MAGLNLLAAIVIYWNTARLGQALTQRRRAGLPVPAALLAHISPLGWAHILLTGEYRWRKKNLTTPLGCHFALFRNGPLSERFDSHHKMPCIRLQGATHIHVHQNDDGVAARRLEERDLVDRWNPPCNG